MSEQGHCPASVAATRHWDGMDDTAESLEDVAFDADEYLKYHACANELDEVKRDRALDCISDINQLDVWSYKYIYYDFNLNGSAGDVTAGPRDRTPTGNVSNEIDAATVVLRERLAVLARRDFEHRIGQAALVSPAVIDLVAAAVKADGETKERLAAVIGEALGDRELTLTHRGQACRLVAEFGDGRSSGEFRVLPAPGVDFPPVRVADTADLVTLAVEPVVRVPGWRDRVSTPTSDIGNLPPSVDQAFSSQSSSIQASKGDAARQLLDPLKARMRAMPSTAYSDKKALSKFVNFELGKLGLAIRCPKTGMPSILGVGKLPRDASRFFIEHRDGGSPVRSYSTTELGALLDCLELMPADPDKGLWGRWARKTRGASDHHAARG